MGWGTAFKPEIYISKISFRSVYELDEKIDETIRSINVQKRRLLILTSGQIKDMIPEEWKDEPISWIDNTFTEIMDSIEEDMRLLFKLELFKEHLTETGTPIENYDPFREFKEDSNIK